MGATDIREPVEVAAVFDPAVRPVKFRWKERVYHVEEITYEWGSRDGRARLIHFSVTDGASLFELAYNTETMKWILEKVDQNPI